MRHVLIDTNVYSAFKQGQKEVVRNLRKPESIIMCSTVLGELLSGFKCGGQTEKNVEELEVFLDKPRVQFVGSDETTAEYYSEIYKALRKKGNPIPTNDMWIAAAALQNGAGLYSLDGYFRTVGGLVLVPPI